MARPSKRTPEVEQAILTALRAGTSRRGAAEYAGIDESTLIRWMRRYADFASAVVQSEAQVEVRAAATIRKAFDAGNWKAALAWLERRRHQDWGRKDRHEILVSVREMARAAGADEDAAVAEAERYLQEIRRGARS